MIPCETEQAYREWLRATHGPTHSRRTAAENAAFFLPHLRPGMQLLDAGCGGGSITMGLAEAVAPGQVTGLDISEEAIEEATGRAGSLASQNVSFEVGDAASLRWEDGTFDVVFCHALLQHVESPLAVLREMRRVLKPGGVIGVADADFDGALLEPSNDALVRSMEIVKRTRRHPNIGKQLRSLLHQAGFGGVTASVSARSRGTAAEVKLEGEFWARYFSADPLVAWVQEKGWASQDELAAMAKAWREWGDDAGAFSASMWCTALASSE